jgi:hypothetical protein
MYDYKVKTIAVLSRGPARTSQGDHEVTAHGVST